MAGFGSARKVELFIFVVLHRQAYANVEAATHAPVEAVADSGVEIYAATVGEIIAKANVGKRRVAIEFQVGAKIKVERDNPHGISVIVLHVEPGAEKYVAVELVAVRGTETDKTDGFPVGSCRRCKIFVRAHACVYIEEPSVALRKFAPKG